METDVNSYKARKACNLPKCKNYERATRLLREFSERLLKEVERNLY